ncbi:DDB1- and CUL4-associated factor 8-like [Mya arenaria]|uniref:DDB1- and CUL4-associated factor 8-like n=1 Tax=Mya arenaria TaxID=6604 RepID=UPI0022E653A2|nr:DDB1- and CUL4-associated factor 8-like [Mya arenaria]
MEDNKSEGVQLHSGSNVKDNTSENDESGFSEDLCISKTSQSELSFADNSLSGQSNITSAEMSLSEKSPENQLSLKKDDSGIFSEKSSSVFSDKSPNVNISDCDGSESVGEPDDNIVDEHELGHNNVQDDEFVRSVDNDCDDKFEDNKVVVESEASGAVMDVDFTISVDLLPKTSSDNSDNVINNKGKSVVSKPCDKTYADNDNDVTDTKDCDRKKVKKQSHKSKLVDYDDSDASDKSDNDVDDIDSDKMTSEKGKRNYRKRKQTSDSETDSGSNDSKEEENANNSGQPVLLRHRPLTENTGNNVVTLSDLSSDSSSEDENKTQTKHDSDSEPEDTPVDITKFGPPKHRWKALFDLRNRESGYSPAQDSGRFARKVQGSLQMVQRFKLQYKMKRHEGCVNALNFNRNGTLLASGSDDLNIVVWNWIRNRPVLVYDSGHRSNVFQCKFMPFSGDCHVVSCARDGQVRLADLSSTGVCKGTKKLAQHRGAAHKLSVENDSPHIILSAGEDAVTFEIDLRLDKPNKLVTTKEADKKVSIYSIHSNPADSNEFCLGGRDHYVRVYDKRKINEEVNDGLLKKFVPEHIAASENNMMKANVTCACYNYNGTEILGTYNDEDIYLFNNTHSDSASYIHRYQGHRNNQTVKGVNFYGPHSEFVVSGSDCGHIFLWDKDTENIVQRMEGDEGGVINVLEPHPHFPVLATSGLDSDVKIWAPTAEKPTELQGLKKAVKLNQREREEERTGEGGMVDGSMLWFIMHHLRQGRRQRARAARAARGEPDPDTDSSDTVSEDEEFSMGESDDSDDPRNQCNPS